MDEYNQSISMLNEQIVLIKEKLNELEDVKFEIDKKSGDIKVNLRKLNAHEDETLLMNLEDEKRSIITNLLVTLFAVILIILTSMLNVPFIVSSVFNVILLIASVAGITLTYESFKNYKSIKKTYDNYINIKEDIDNDLIDQNKLLNKEINDLISKYPNLEQNISSLYELLNNALNTLNSINYDKNIDINNVIDSNMILTR